MGSDWENSSALVLVVWIGLAVWWIGCAAVVLWLTLRRRLSARLERQLPRPTERLELGEIPTDHEPQRASLS